MTGKRTLATELQKIAKPDEIEQFLKSLVDLRFEMNTASQVTKLETKEDLFGTFCVLETEEALGMYYDTSFQNFYLTTKGGSTYEIALSKENRHYLTSLLSSEKTVKYVFQSFSFMKWCHVQGIEPKNVCDILMYLKLLTNQVDLSKDLAEYVQKYASNGEEAKLALETAPESVLGDFICQFGDFLASITAKLGLESVCKMIHENSYYESELPKEEDSLCQIRFSYVNLGRFLEDYQKDLIQKHSSKAYLKSPLRKDCH